MGTSFTDLPQAPWFADTPQSDQPATAAPSGPVEAPWFTETKEPAQPGYFRAIAANGSPVYAPDNPQMRAMFAEAPKPEAPKPEPSFWGTVSDTLGPANTGTAVARMPGMVAGLPHSLGQIYAGVSGDKGPGLASFARENLPSEPQYTRSVFDALNLATGKDFKPYVPQTGWGRVYQDTLAGAPLAAVGGGGLRGLLSREFANVGGNAGGEITRDMFPDGGAAQTVGTLFGALAGGGVPGFASGTAEIAGRLKPTVYRTEKAAAKALVNGSETGRQGLIDAIDNGMPSWRFETGTLQPAPNLGTVTQDPGIQGMIFRDAAAAEQAGNPIYRTNDLITNQAQREAVSRITPNIQPDIAQAQSDLSSATGGLPIGVTAQNAGSDFRQNLQTVYDQRVNARKAVGTGFDVLDTSPAQITLQPVMDYATEQAAQNAGEVGKAYAAAGAQFKSGTGITLDTAPFANSVLKGLGDLAESYPKGSAAQRAVLDIKNRAEAHIEAQEPAITQARADWADASKPLDVFNPQTTPGPIANAVQTTRFGGYTTANDSVVSQFLRSNGGPDAIDKLSGVFGDVGAAVQPLKDFIASEVQARALTNGTVDLNKLNTIVSQYNPVLSKLPFADLKRQFTTIEGAQKAVDGLAARQNLYENFSNGLNSTMQTDMGGNFMYSPRRFNDFVNQNRGDLVTAYGTDGASRIEQINKQLTDMAQNAYVRRPGQSGTPQAMASKHGNILTNLFAFESGAEGVFQLMGAYSGAVENILGEGAVGRLAGLGIANRIQAFNQKVEEVTRAGLADPEFARSLLVKYNPKLPSTAGQKAMTYVQNRLAGIAAPLEAQQGQQ